MSGKTDRRITFLSLTTAALPPDGSGVAWWLAWCGGRWFSSTKERSMKPKPSFFSRIYCNIRKPLMPIRYPIAFRGTARPSVCSAWRLKVPKIERLTHPKPYIVPKPFACFSLICSSRNPISCRNSVLCRNLLFVSALFAQAETLVFRGTWSGCAQRETSVRFRHQRNLQAFFITFCFFAFWCN